MGDCFYLHLFALGLVQILLCRVLGHAEVRIITAPAGHFRRVAGRWAWHRRTKAHTGLATQANKAQG